MPTARIVCAAAIVAATVPAAAQTRPARPAETAAPHVEQAVRSQVQMTISDGRVSISARQASLAQVLSEYSRLFGVRIDVPAEVGSTPITIELSDVPERQAFEALLRGVGGFVLVPRTGPDRRGIISGFARVVVVAAARTAGFESAGQSAVQSSVPIAPGVNQLLGGDGQPIPDDQADVPIVQPPPATSTKRPGRRP